MFSVLASQQCSLKKWSQEGTIDFMQKIHSVNDTTSERNAIVDTSQNDQPKKLNYRIRPNFRSTQFSWIALSKHFAKTIFADQGF